MCPWLEETGLLGKVKTVFGFCYKVFSLNAVNGEGRGSDVKIYFQFFNKYAMSSIY